MAVIRCGGKKSLRLNGKKEGKRRTRRKENADNSMKVIKVTTPVHREESKFDVYWGGILYFAGPSRGKRRERGQEAQYSGRNKNETPRKGENRVVWEGELHGELG